MSENKNQKKRSAEEEYIISQMRACIYRLEAGNLSVEVIDLMKSSIEIMLPMLDVMKSEIRNE